MPIADTDIEHRYSVDGSFEDPQPDKDDSLGGELSATEIPDDTLNNDMSDITSAEAAAGVTKYRGWMYVNKHASLTYIGPKMWIESQTSSADTSVAIGMAVEAKNLPIEVITNELTPPSTVVFSTPANFAAGLAVGDLDPDDYKGHWLKYIVTAGANAVVDTYTLAIRGDTNP